MGLRGAPAKERPRARQYPCGPDDLKSVSIQQFDLSGFADYRHIRILRKIDHLGVSFTAWHAEVHAAHLSIRCCAYLDKFIRPGAQFRPFGDNPVLQINPKEAAGLSLEQRERSEIVPPEPQSLVFKER